MSSPISFNSVVFILYNVLLILSEAETRLECIVNDVDEFGFPRPYGIRKIVYCNSQDEKCCTKGCCPAQASWYIWPLIIIGAIIVSIFCACIHLYNREHCKNMSGSSENYQESATLPPNEASIASPLAREETEIGSRQIGVTLLPRQYNNSKGMRRACSDIHIAMVPPPTYNVAIFASPEDPNDRIPSYEHVISGKKS